MDKEEAKKKIAELISDFEKNRDYYEKTAEANIETKLIEPLFEALGWTKADYEKRDPTKRKDRRGITDYTFKHGGKSVFVLEAKKVKVDVDWDKETWKQAVSYTFSKRVSFAVLTNFKNLLIFCPEDEKAMRPFVNLKYSEYLASDELWLLSKESFEKNLIFEKAAGLSLMKKRRTIDDELLADLLSSRKSIVASIEQNYKGKYTTIEKDDIAQRIFGRLIFIRKCEDKQINFDKDNKEIERLKEITLLPHNEAYPKLKKIFSKYNEAFDSGLFTKDLDSDVDKIDIDGKAIKELIDHSYDSRDGNYIYNFEWIDADVLGNIYEQYLGHILKETAKQTRMTESHAHRKEQGIYYTPTEIVKYIVENTLGEMLKEKKPEEVRKLKVLDPACGSGSFLIKAFDVLEEYYEKHPVEKQKRLDSTGDFYTLKEQVLVNNIHGVDLDHKAVEIAQLNLLLKVAEKGHRLPLLQKNIQKGNSLIDDESVAGDKAFKWEERFADIMNDGGFDVIIGNPPYFNLQTIENETSVDYFEKNYQSFRGKADILFLFIERANQLLKEGGFLGFIVASYFLRSHYADKLRQFISKNYEIVKITDFGEVKIFQDANVDTCILILRKKSSKKRFQYSLLYNEKFISDFIKKSNTRIEKSIITNDYSFVIAEQPTRSAPWIFGEKTIEKTIPLNNLCNIGKGAASGNDNIFVISNDDASKLDLEKNIIESVVEDSTIDRYQFKLSKNVLIKTRRGTDISTYPNTRKYLEQNRVELQKRYAVQKEGLKWFEIVRYNDELFSDTVKEQIYAYYRSTHNKFAYSNKRYVTLTTTFVLTKKEENDIDLRYLVGILNSKFMENYSRKNAKKMGSCYEYSSNFIGSMPIKKLPKSEQESIIVLVDYMLSLNKKLTEFGDKNTSETARLKDDISKTDAQIDELVYKIYGITEEEKKVIEESLK